MYADTRAAAFRDVVVDVYRSLCLGTFRYWRVVRVDVYIQNKNIYTYIVYIRAKRDKRILVCYTFIRSSQLSTTQHTTISIQGQCRI